MLPPGPSSHPAVQAFRYLREPFAFLDDCAKRFGDKFTVRVPRRPPLVFINEPDAIKEIFAAPTDVVLTGEANASVGFTFGRHSLILLDGKRHERERRLLMPPFHGERMATYLEQIVHITERAMGPIRPGDTFSIRATMETITLDVILECVFGIGPGPRQERFRDLLRTFIKEGKTTPAYMHVLGMLFRDRAAFREFLATKVAPMTDVLPSVLRFLPTASVARCIRDLDRLLFDDIAVRRAKVTKGGVDVMSMLLAARYEDGRGLGDEELRDEMMTMLIAGHDTTATTLAFAVSKLLESPHVLEQVRDELARVVGARALTPELLRELKYLDATVKEVLRLYDPAPGFARVLAKPLRVGGYDLPAGVMVTTSTYLLHRDPRFWTNPHGFDPSRFLDRRVRPTQYVPFGGGSRTCLGMAFALYETKVVLAHLIHRTRLRAIPGPPLNLAIAGLIYGPSHDVPVILERRAA
ncbi:cytochrome P450 [Pendulispora rubella]|uniref:Cytochrome P450 n=1 Tax=Pendulispora rubella TaxID=2741070 RepID=A0ABZ2KXI3_9BACT